MRKWAIVGGLVLAIGLAGYAGWLIYQQSSQIEELRASVAANEERLGNLVNTTESLHTRLEKVDERSDTTAGIVNNMRGISGVSIEDLESRLSDLEDDVDDLNSLVGYRGNYATGIWANVQTLRNCMEWMMQNSPLEDLYLPPNSCRVVRSGIGF